MPSSGTQGDSAEVEVAISRTPPPNRQKRMSCVGRVVCVFSLREDTQEGLVGLCEAGCRVLSVSAAPALGRERVLRLGAVQVAFESRGNGSEAK